MTTPTQSLHTEVASRLRYASETLDACSTVLPIIEEFSVAFPDLWRNSSCDWSSWRSTLKLLAGAIKSVSDIAPVLRWFAARGFTQSGEPKKNLQYGYINYELSRQADYNMTGSPAIALSFQVTFPVADTAGAGQCTIVKKGTKTRTVEEPEYELVCPPVERPDDGAEPRLTRDLAHARAALASGAERPLDVAVDMDEAGVER